jgi:hypothetical protein
MKDVMFRNTDRYFWHRKVSRLRLQVSLTVYVHHYQRSADRIVIQPSIVYDRKAR